MTRSMGCIRDVRAYPTSFPLPKENQVTLGVGRTIKRDAVVVKVTTDGGLVGWGESHHGRAHTAIATLVNDGLAPLIIGMDALDVVGVWDRIYRGQLASHGMGAAAAMAMSGIDMALWDIRGKAVGWPLYRLLGGAPRAAPAYAGGVALGWQDPASLADEAASMVERGFMAIKLRLGDGWRNDIARVQAVRRALGGEVEILADANTGYTMDDARRAIPALDETAVGWLEEPFSPHDSLRYRTAREFGALPFAAGENHYTKTDFAWLIDAEVVTVLQPDLSKVGGVTEAMRIAAMASAKGLVIHPHSSMTGINAAATVHMLSAIDNAGYYEADVSVVNRFRDDLVSNPCPVSAEGTVLPPEGPGLGIEVDEAFLHHHPPIPGPAYVAA